MTPSISTTTAPQHSGITSCSNVLTGSLHLLQASRLNVLMWISTRTNPGKSLSVFRNRTHTAVSDTTHWSRRRSEAESERLPVCESITHSDCLSLCHEYRAPQSHRCCFPSRFQQRARMPRKWEDKLALQQTHCNVSDWCTFFKCPLWCTCMLTLRFSKIGLSIFN